MDYRTFNNFLEQKMKQMNQADLMDIIREMGRHIPEKFRHDIVEQFSHNCKTPNIKKDYILKQYEKALNICKAISNNEKYLRTTEEYYYDDYNYGREEITNYYDEDEIEKDIKNVASIANWLIYKKEYKYAEVILDKIASLEILIYSVEYEEDYFYTIEELVDEGVFSVDIRTLSIETLYAVYMITDKKERPQKLYQHYGWYPSNLVKLEELITIGPERLPDFKDFIAGWIDILKNKSGNVVEVLLEDAFTYLEGKDALEKYAKQLYSKFPNYYLHWFEELFSRKEYNKLILEADLAFKSLTNVSSQRYLIANIIYLVSKELENGNMMYRSSQVMFEASPCVKTYLRLKTLPLKEELCNDINILINLDTISCTSKIDKMLIEVLNGNYNNVWRHVSKNKNGLGWSIDPIGVIVPFFLLLLVKENKISPLMESFLLNIQSRIDYNKQMDDLDLVYYYKIWRKVFHISVDDRDKLFKWCETMVNKRVIGIVSNQYRKAYQRAAEISLLLSEVAYYIGKTNQKFEIALKYQAMFPRHIAFKREYRELLNNQGDLNG